MRMFTIITTIAILVMMLFISSYKLEGGTKEEFYEQTNILPETMFNLTKNNIPYTNQFNTTPTLNATIYNLIHGVVYGITVELMTIIPAITEFTWKYISPEKTMQIIKILLITLAIWLLTKMFLPTIATYIFIGDIAKEKYNKELKWYTKTILTIIFWGTILGGIIIIGVII